MHQIHLEKTNYMVEIFYDNETQLTADKLKLWMTAFEPRYSGK